MAHGSDEAGDARRGKESRHGRTGRLICNPVTFDNGRPIGREGSKLTIAYQLRPSRSPDMPHSLQGCMASEQREPCGMRLLKVRGT